MTNAVRPLLGLVEDSPEDFAAFQRVVARQAPGVMLHRWPHAEALLDDLAADRPGVAWPTALVVDLNLPGIDGAELVRRLRASPSTQSLPTFVLSGSERQQDVDRCYAAGANAYLTKPGGSAELHALLRMLLASIAAFRTPTSVGGTSGLTPADLATVTGADEEVDQAAIEEERARYEERLREERAGRKRAEALQRLSTRLAEATTPEEIERDVVACVLGRPSVREARIDPSTDDDAPREGVFMPDPFGEGTVAFIPLIDGTRVRSVLRAELDGELSDDDEALVHGAASLAGQALARLERRAAAEVGAGDLPTERWWSEAAGGALRECQAANLPMSVAVVELDLPALSAEAGHVAADERLLEVIDAWRQAEFDLLAPHGTETLVALLPGRNTRQAQAVVREVLATLDDRSHLACAVAQWDGAETPGALVARARGAVRSVDQPRSAAD